MAYREVGMFEVKEVLRLFFAGVPNKAIARTVGVDVKTVRRYVRQATELGLEPPLEDEKLATLFAALKHENEREHGAAYKSCEEQRELIAKLLEDGVRLTKVRKLLERRDVVVPYATLHRFAVKELDFGRSASSVLVVDAPPGRELQVDTGFVVTLTQNGKRVRKKAFVFTPSLSRYRFVYPVERETTEAAIEACEAAWAFYGGVFEVLLPDNTKAIVTLASATSPRITEAFQEYAQARGFVVDPARVRKPQDKGRVERSVAYVRDDCFGGEELSSIEAARERALRWCEHEAGMKVHGTTKRRSKEHFLAEERSRLLPAPVEPYDVPRWADVTVDKTQHVSAFEALYMLPERCIGRRLRARADRSLVRFYDRGVLVKVLPRAERGGRSFDPQDIAEHKRPFALRDEGFLAEQALSHGQHIGAFANKLLEGRAPWTRMRRVAALLGLVRRFGAERVEETCKRALEHEMHDVDRLRRMLEQPATIDDGPRARVIPIARYLRPSSTWAITKNEGEQQ